MFSSDDEDDQTERVATDSRITYAIAMNNRMAQDGCSSSGSSGSRCNGSIGNSGSSTNAITEPTSAVEQTTVRYPKRQRRPVNYQEQLDTPDDDYYICKYILFATLFLEPWGVLPGLTQDPLVAQTTGRHIDIPY